jgi:N-methylhydantoinase A
MSYSSCIDIGGTFTDLVVYSTEFGTRQFKVLTNRENPEIGFMAALEKAAMWYNISLKEFLKNHKIIVHGTTITTNALIEKKTNTTGLICNYGHPDILLLRESPTKKSFKTKTNYPDPFIPRIYTKEIRGRILSSGCEYEKLNERDVHDAINYFTKLGIRTIAVSLLWSVVNKSHELRVREIISECCPDMYCSLSHEVNPFQREYRRTIATAFNAALYPLMKNYIENLKVALESSGYSNQLLISTCEGGMLPPQEIIKKPVLSVMSGPTLAPIAALGICTDSHLVVADMGGTTFDVCVVREHKLQYSSESNIGDDFLGVPRVDVRSVGSGGGSIAWVDSGGLLRVGPQSSGSYPGPACYSNGGELPTVTDAVVVLGIIDSSFFLGGSMVIDKNKSVKALSTLSKYLNNITIIEIAWAIYMLVTEQMIRAIENITIEDGLDPRICTLICGGGATGCHAGYFIKNASFKRGLLPRFGATLSAFGGLLANVIHSESVVTNEFNSVSYDFSMLFNEFEKLKKQNDIFLKKCGTFNKISYKFTFNARYKFQSWDIECEFSMDKLLDISNDEYIKYLSELFHARHELLHGHRNENDVVEFISWTVKIIGDMESNDKVLEKKYKNSILSPVSPVNYREVYLGAKVGYSIIPVYRCLSESVFTLLIEGPAIIEEMETTILILSGQKFSLDNLGNYVIENM